MYRNQQTVGLDYFYTVLVRDAEKCPELQNDSNIRPTSRQYPFDGNINDQSGNGRHLIAKDNDSSLLQHPALDKIVLVKIMLQ